MATKFVGIRELKESAPLLVQQAQAGDRIVITRHGKPVAVLSPLGASDAAASHPSQATWERERQAFDQMLPRLEQRYAGRYVAIASGKVVGSDRDHEALYRRIWEKLKGRTFYVGRIGAPPEAVDMPGFDLA